MEAGERGNAAVNDSRGYTASMQYELGFIGAGNMAEAIARGAVRGAVLPVTRIFAADPAMPRRGVFQQIGITTGGDATDVVTRCRVIVLAVKPQTLPKLADMLAKIDAATQTVISIMAGVKAESLEAMIGDGARVVRVMPNTPLMVQRGMSAVARGAHATAEDEAFAMRLFGACGHAIAVEESLIDAVTAVSGSGPAYVFYLAEAMREAANDLGLGEHAAVLVNQTLLGASELLCKSDEGPAELRAKVTSPGGTTEAAINHLDDNGVNEMIVQALKAARDRSVELGKHSG